MGSRKQKQYTQTTLEVEAQGEKCEAIKASSPGLTEESPISLATLRAELRTEFKSYRDSMQNVIKTEMESLCKGIRDDISSLRETTKADIKTIRDELTEKVDNLFTLQTEAAETQKSMEQSLSDNCDRVTSLENSYQTLAAEHKKLQEKCIDLENRSRRQNIRIIGIPEGIEANKPTEFLSKFLTKVLGEENFDGPILIDRAHRSLAPKPRAGERPRPMIARLHYYADKDKIMLLSRTKGKLFFEGSPVHIFPDMSPEVGRQRAAFNPVKVKLRNAGIPYRMLFPAKLEITMDGSRMSFSDPRAVERLVEANASSSQSEGT